MKLAKLIRVLILGAPGTGKAIQCRKINSAFPAIRCLCAGDIIRTEMPRGSLSSFLVTRLMEEGRVVPDDMMIALTQNHLLEKDLLSTYKSWAILGIPRTENQAITLDKELKRHNAWVNMVIELDIDDETLLKRVQTRWIHPPSGRVYNLNDNPPKEKLKDDVTGEPLQQRPGDVADLFMLRLREYREEAEKIRNHYSKRGIYHKIHGQTTENMFPKIRDLLALKFGRMDPANFDLESLQGR